MWMRLMPAIVLAGVVLIAGLAVLTGGEKSGGSALVGQPLPDFATEAAGDIEAMSAADITTRPAIINVFASWCVPCVAEAGYLNRLAAGDNAAIYGIAYRDTAEKARAFVQKHGNPYQRIGIDESGKALIALGGTGVPETILIDKKGIVRFHHVGPVLEKDMARIRLMLRDLTAE